MSYEFDIFEGGLDEGYVEWLTGDEYISRAIRFEKLWNYYENPTTTSIAGNNSGSGRTYQQWQEYGLPLRITGISRSFWGGLESGENNGRIARKEVVVENDIAWRIDTIVDFLFGRKFSITSRASDPDRAGEIERVLNAIFEANGGMQFFQQLALMGSIYGFVDVIVRTDKLFAEQQEISTSLERCADKVVLEIIEPVRSLPVLNENDYRRIEYYIQHYYKQHNELGQSTVGGIGTVDGRGNVGSGPRESRCVEIISDQYWQRYEDGDLTAQGRNVLGCMPIVHIQNLPIPYRYEGKSDVEPLVPLQDELNTRLSDRASRITMQSFKMYLAKGISNFDQLDIGPGTMWNTENPNAAVEEFGGDESCPSEAEHISQVRDALEKSSGVAAIAAGMLRGRIGNLTSAVALKITLMGILAKNQRKRMCYGKGIAEMSKLILDALTKSGVFETDPSEREIDIHWPNPLPENVTEILQEAKMKMELGIDKEQVLKELGY